MYNTAAFHTHKKLIVNTFEKTCVIYILVGNNEYCNIYLQNKLTTGLFSYSLLGIIKYLQSTKFCPQVLQTSKQLILQGIRTLSATDHLDN